MLTYTVAYVIGIARCPIATSQPFPIELGMFFPSSTEKGPRSCDWLELRLWKKKWFHMIVLNFILWKKLRHNTKVSHTSLRHLISVLAPPEVLPRHIGFSLRLTLHLFFTQTQLFLRCFGILLIWDSIVMKYSRC